MNARKPDTTVGDALIGNWKPKDLKRNKLFPKGVAQQVTKNGRRERNVLCAVHIGSRLTIECRLTNVFRPLTFNRDTGVKTPSPSGVAASGQDLGGQTASEEDPSKGKMHSHGSNRHRDEAGEIANNWELENTDLNNPTFQGGPLKKAKRVKKSHNTEYSLPIKGAKTRRIVCIPCYKRGHIKSVFRELKNFRPRCKHKHGISQKTRTNPDETRSVTLCYMLD